MTINQARERQERVLQCCIILLMGVSSCILIRTPSIVMLATIPICWSVAKLLEICRTSKSK
jgi:hypothetical protein